jgi:hypothetical protein
VISRDWANFGSSSWRPNLREEVNVGLVVLAPLTRKIVFVIDRLNWANRLTGSAVHALIRVDVEHAVALVNTVNWTFIDASLVLDIYTWQRNNIRQLELLGLLVQILFGVENLDDLER